jgi:hypothetical protein
MFEGFLLRRFDRGLSAVEPDDPETREGVRVLLLGSGLGKRDDEAVEIFPCRPLAAPTDLETATR